VIRGEALSLLVLLSAFGGTAKLRLASTPLALRTLVMLCNPLHWAYQDVCERAAQ
jgi:hypothetical protein